MRSMYKYVLFTETETDSDDSVPIFEVKIFSNFNKAYAKFREEITNKIFEFGYKSIKAGNFLDSEKIFCFDEGVFTVKGNSEDFTKICDVINKTLIFPNYIYPYDLPECKYEDSDTKLSADEKGFVYSGYNFNYDGLKTNAFIKRKTGGNYYFILDLMPDNYDNDKVSHINIRLIRA